MGGVISVKDYSEFKIVLDNLINNRDIFQNKVKIISDYIHSKLGALSIIQMKYKMKKIILNLTIIIFTVTTYSQSDVYSYSENDIINRVIIDNNYLVMTSYKVDSNKFIKTIGGFYNKEGNRFNISLEFNSNLKMTVFQKLK